MTHKKSILVVDDDSAMREMLISLLEDQHFTAVGSSSGQEAVELARGRPFDAVLSDIRMPGMDGIELLGQIREARPNTPVILMTAFGSIDSAVSAMRAGAFDYITKPFKREEVMVVLERAFERRALVEENERLRRAVDRTSSFGDLLGQSAAMRDIYALIRRIADSQTTVLVTGESGTGKEVVARTIHFSGSRASQPFVPINCTAIPEGLLESELFGHVRGAFTGATSNKEGLFAKASGGTIFLDEIGDMGGALQSKLLRILQDGEIRPVGGTQSSKVDVRVIAATNKDLSQEIAEGRFRQDLFFRLNVIPVHIPPMRERPEDVALLAEEFVARLGGGQRTISHAGLQHLMRCRWEGNARELENVIERSLLLSDRAELGPDDLIVPGRANVVEALPLGSFLTPAVERKMTLQELGELYTAEILEFTGGNKLRAAEILGINRRTLYRRAERKGMNGTDAPERAAQSA